MKYKTLFRILLKAIGVYLIASNFGFVVQLAITFLMDMLSSSGTGGMFGSQLGWSLRFSGGGILSFLFGFYLFFGGKWIVNCAIPSNRPYCQECGYELTRSRSTRCPECGTPFRAEDVTPPASLG